MRKIRKDWKRFFVVLMIVCLAVGVVTAFAAAPDISMQSSGQLTTNGYSAVSYTGYLNGESFQQDAITTYNGWQYSVYWNSAKHVNIARRQLPSGAWQNVELTDYATTSTDSHNTISMGISYADGSIHIAYDMHNNVLHYRKSVAGLATNPGTAVWSASSFGAPTNGALGNLTMPISSLTYPQFINAPGNKLQFSIRDGSSGNGNQWLFEYSSTGTWSTVGQYLDGISSGQNAYLFGTEYDSVGRLHTTWTWRATPDGSSNHDIYYAYSDDQGRTWKNNAGTLIATTGSTYITASSPGILVWTIPQNRGLMNQESQVVDSDGIVHVLASALPSAAADQTNFTTARNASVLYHYYRDIAGVWHQQETTYQEASQRGDIIVDSLNNLYVVYGNSNSKVLSVATASKASNWTDWTVKYTSGAIYFSDPLVDHARIKLENMLSVFSPWNASGNIDILDFNVNCTCTPAPTPTPTPTPAPGSNLALTSVVTASSSYETTSWGKAKVIDGIRTSTSSSSRGWTSNSSLGSNHTEWLQFDIGSSRTIGKVDLYPRNDGVNTGYGFPVDFTIQTSTDGITWTTQVTQTAYALPGGVLQSFPFTSTTARYVKVNATSLRSNPNDANQYRMQFAEAEIY